MCNWVSKQRILHEWSFYRKFMKQALANFINFIWNDHECTILFIIWPLKIRFHHHQNGQYFKKKNGLLIRAMTLRLHAKVLLHVWSYDSYDTIIRWITYLSYDKYFFKEFEEEHLFLSLEQRYLQFSLTHLMPQLSTYSNGREIMEASFYC